MPEKKLISICIPAYKRAGFLKRLLDSILDQDCNDFEVIVTDDSPGNEIEILCLQFEKKIPLTYRKNASTLGTPENWNESVRHARGEWIKLMHDDDWFAGPGSLSSFSDAIKINPDASFIFSAYKNVYLDEERVKDVFLPAFRFKQLSIDPASLFSSNVIGPPSVTIYKKREDTGFDKNLKWLVDIDFYIRYLKNSKPVYINKPLVNVGIGSQQVTMDCFRQRKIEIPEGFYLLNRTGQGVLKNIMVYDAWWRLLRNLEIKNTDEIIESGYSGPLPEVIRSMVRAQKKLPGFLLKTGITSKTFMFMHYIFNRKRIKD